MQHSSCGDSWPSGESPHASFALAVPHPALIVYRGSNKQLNYGNVLMISW